MNKSLTEKSEHGSSEKEEKCPHEDSHDGLPCGYCGKTTNRSAIPAHESSKIDQGTDRVIDAVMKVEPTREGRLEVRLAVVNRGLEIQSKLAHDLGIIGKADGHAGQFSECKYGLCAHYRHLVENTYQMLFKEEAELDHEPDPDRDAHDPDLPPPSEMFKEVT